MKRLTMIVALGALLPLAACGSDDGAGDVGADTDTGADTTLDTSADADADAGTDTTTDTDADTTTDTGTDTTTDTGTDTSTDTDADTCVPDCSGMACGDDGCGGSCGTCAGTDTCDAGACVPVAALSFATDVYPIIETNCTPCHTAGTSGGLSMADASTAYSNLVDVASVGSSSHTRVISGDGASSYIVLKLQGANSIAGQRMPAGRAALGDADIQAIIDWADAGAAP